MLLRYSSVFTDMALSATKTWLPRRSEELLFFGELDYSYALHGF